MVLSSRSFTRLSSSFAVLFCTLNAHAELSANLGVTSEYVRDGISETSGNPTFQGGLTLTDDSGLYGGLITSGIDHNDDDIEYEHSLFAGFYQPVGDYLALDLFANRYVFAGDSQAENKSYNEGGMRLLINDAVMLGWRETGSYMGSQHSFRSLELGYTLQWGEFSLEFFTAQHRWLETDHEDYNFDEDTGRDSYYQFRVGVDRTYGQWDYRLTVNRTNLSSEYDAGTSIQFGIQRYFNFW